MDTLRGLIPHPRFGCQNRYAAGSYNDPSEKPVEYVNAFRPDVSSSAFSTMLGLLETLKNLVLSGHEPASFLIAAPEDGRPVMVAADSPAELPRLRHQYGVRSPIFWVSLRKAAAGSWLSVDEPTGQTGYRLEQFCRALPGGGHEALPYCWSRSSASSAYQRTSGFTPYWGFRNSSLLNHLIS